MQKSFDEFKAQKGKRTRVQICEAARCISSYFDVSSQKTELKRGLMLPKNRTEAGPNVAALVEVAGCCCKTIREESATSKFEGFF